jgi:hypothetical protein
MCTLNYSDFRNMADCICLFWDARLCRRTCSYRRYCQWRTWRTGLFSIYLFQFSVCFEQPRAHHQENKLYQYNIWCVSLWPFSMQVELFLPDLHTRRSPTQSDTYQMLYWYNWLSWWWARGCSKHVENWNKHIEKELCAKLVIYKNYTEMAARSTEHKKLQTC